MPMAAPSVDAFVEAACVPLGAAHSSGTLDQAEAIRAATPGITRAAIHAAAAYGDEEAVAHWLSRDGAAAATAIGPRGWDPLTCLCFSRYLRDDRARADAFLRAAARLLDAGARATTGFFDETHGPTPAWESVLYGAAGIAHDGALTRLLLAHGAEPNDDEVVYHAPESYDLAPVEALVEHGGLTADSMAILLARKHDWHDRAGVTYLLAHGADPDRMTRWGVTALHQAIRRDNAHAIVEALLAHGADPRRPMEPPAAPEGHALDAIALAAWRGRADLLASFDPAGHMLDGEEPHALVAACALGDASRVTRIADLAPASVAAVRTRAGRVLGEFAGNGNVEGLRCLLSLGLPVDARWDQGDGYFQIAPRSTALHVASWRARHDAVRALIAHGASVHAADGAGRTPLALAVRACVDSYWSDRRAPDSIAALLDAGADPRAVTIPTGYDAADRLLSASRR